MLDFVACCWPAMLLAFLQAFKGVVFAAKLKLSVNQRFTVVLRNYILLTSCHASLTQTLSCDSAAGKSHPSVTSGLSRNVQGSMPCFSHTKGLLIAQFMSCTSHSCHVIFSVSRLLLVTSRKRLLIGTCIKIGLNKPYFHSLRTASKKWIVLGLTSKVIGNSREKVVDL